MADFEAILDQKLAVRHLKTLLIKGTIPHALLFSGIEGVGKRSAAIAFAMACNCAERLSAASIAAGEQTPYPCKICRSCKKIQSRNHPDIIRVEPIGAHIRIAQIRELRDTLAMRLYEARIRVVIVSDAQAMNPEAGNALLKVLEEPPDRTVLILTALQITDLLPTIVSRCQHIRFNPISGKTLAAFLAEHQRLDPDQAWIAAVMAGGSITKALALNQGIWLSRRKWLLEEMTELSSRSTGAQVAFAERLAKDKDLLDDSLEIIKHWLRDLVVYKYDPRKILNIDLADNISNASSKTSTASLLAQIETIQSAQNALNSNTNLRLTLERMVLRLGNRAKHHASRNPKLDRTSSTLN